MCDHPAPFKKSDPIDEPKYPNHCHIYYIHQDGSIFYHPNARFNKATNGSPKPQMDANGNNDMDSATNRENVTVEAFCGDDRLTLMYTSL
jgi:hypothetical protein